MWKMALYMGRFTKVMLPQVQHRVQEPHSCQGFQYVYVCVCVCVRLCMCVLVLSDKKGQRWMTPRTPAVLVALSYL